MLGETRRTRQKHFLLLDCRKPYFDKNGFGMKMLRQMGWQEGCGLGKNLQGLAAPIRPSYNLTRRGLSTVDERCVDVVDHQKSFSDLLAVLNAESQQNSMETVPMSSLEERSKNSRRHIHYHKLIRGKDVSKYSLKDFEGIMGKKATEDSLAFLKKSPCTLDMSNENLTKMTEESEHYYSCKNYEEDKFATEVSSVVIESESVKEGKKKRKKTNDEIRNENTGIKRENESILTGRTSDATDSKAPSEDKVETVMNTPKKKSCIYGYGASESAKENGYLFPLRPEKIEEVNSRCVPGSEHLSFCLGNDDFGNNDEVYTILEMSEPRIKKTRFDKIYNKSLRVTKDCVFNHSHIYPEKKKQTSHTESLSEIKTCAVQSINLKEKALSKRTNEKKQKRKSVVDCNSLDVSIIEQHLSSRHGSIVSENPIDIFPDLNDTIQSNKQLEEGTNNCDLNQNRRNNHQYLKKELTERNRKTHLMKIPLQNEEEEEEEEEKKKKKKKKEKKEEKKKTRREESEKKKKRGYEVCEVVVESLSGKVISEGHQDLITSRKVNPAEKTEELLIKDSGEYAMCSRKSDYKKRNDESSILFKVHDTKQHCNSAGTNCEKLSDENMCDRVCFGFIGANLLNIKGYGNY